MATGRFQHTISLNEADETNLRILQEKGIKFIDIFRFGVELKLKELKVQTKTTAPTK